MTRERQADRSAAAVLSNMDMTVTPAGQTGAKTINKMAGTVNLAALASSLVLTNNKILPSDKCLVFAQPATVDASMLGITVVQNPAGGSVTFVPVGSAPAGEVRINWWVILTQS